MVVQANTGDVALSLRKAGKLGSGLGKTTGWIHRAALHMRNVEMVGGVNYERITPQGLFVTFGEQRRDGTLIECDTVVLCSVQEPLRELQAPLVAAGVSVDSAMSNFSRPGRTIRRVAISFCMLTVAASSATALQLSLSEGESETLIVDVVEIHSASDAATATRIRSLPFVKSTESLPNRLIVNLDSTPGISRYLRAARLGGGVYVHLLQLCPDQNCDGISFRVNARLVLHANQVVPGPTDIRLGSFFTSAVFFTNEASPRLADNVYTDPRFSLATDTKIRQGFAAVRSVYQEFAGVDLLAGRFVVATEARDREGALGFGGDFLNVVRVTFHNRREEPDEVIVQRLVRSLAHEIAHAAHSIALISMRPQGRVISEGSADFLRLLVLKKSGLATSEELVQMVVRSFDECEGTRGSSNLLARVASGTASVREYYSCGMIFFLGLFLENLERNGVRDEGRFLRELFSAFGGAPSADSGFAKCALMMEGCELTAFRELLGDAAQLKAARQRFVQSWTRYLAL